MVVKVRLELQPPPCQGDIHNSNYLVFIGNEFLIRNFMNKLNTCKKINFNITHLKLHQVVLQNE